MFGYSGRILIVDLTWQAAHSEPLPEPVARAVIGGAGLGTWLLHRWAPPGVNPLAPENPLIFAASPFLGTGITTTSKYTLVTKSPLTGFLNDSLSSSHLALALKASGWDAVVITGAAASPTLLLIDGTSVQFLDASAWWGLETQAAEAAIEQQFGPGVHAAVIGPAGEALVRYATVTNDGRHAGRGGAGAVMGAKRLKAVAFRSGQGRCGNESPRRHGDTEESTERVDEGPSSVFLSVSPCLRGELSSLVAHPDALREAAAALSRRSLGPETAKYRVLGTTTNLLAFDRLGALPSYNFRQSTFDGAERVSGEKLRETRSAGRSACAACTIGCEQRYRTTNDQRPTTDDRRRVSTVHGPPSMVSNGRRLEYETLFALGPLLGIDDPDAVLEAASLCDRLGLDTLSAGGTIAWAMGCSERGLLSARAAGQVIPLPADQPALTPSPSPSDRWRGGRPAPLPMLGEGQGVRAGPPLRFGDADAVLDLLRQIASRSGLGDLLAEGSRAASARLGGGSERWAMHVKGLELPGYEPRSLKTMALGLATCPRGACHNRSAAYEADLSGRVDRLTADAERGRLAAESEDFAAVLDSLILCKFVRGCFDDFYAEAATLLHYVTGWDVTGDELRRAGERITNLKKDFNLREGWRPEDDTLPPRLLEEALPTGPAAGVGLTRDELKMMIDAYYAARGWTADGRIPREKRQELGLTELVGPDDDGP